MIPEFKHFCRDLSPGSARALFKKSVNSISFAISSYCNRQCEYCPNVIADRKSHRHYVADGLFFNVLHQLCAIEYDGIFHIHRYNEPLADRDYALARLRDIRVFLPKADIRIFTNGDYLDRPYLDAIAALDVDEIDMTVHAGAGGKTDIQSLLAEQDRRMEMLGLKFEITSEDPLKKKYRIASAQHDSGLKLNINAGDFYRGREEGRTWAFDRGGLLPMERTYARSKPCLSQFMEMEIEWDGTLLPCCQIHNDAFPHDDYVLGKLTEESDIFIAWTGLKYAEWRLKMSMSGPKAQPCATCDYGLPPAELLTDTVNMFQQIHAVMAQASARANAGT